MAYNVRGEHERAIAVYPRALGLARKRADRSAVTRFCVLLANVLIDQGSLTRSQELLAHAIALSTETTDPTVLARLYWAESRLHVAKRSFDLAARYAHLTLAALELSENSYYEARGRHLLAYIELERGQPGEALELLDAALPLIEEAGDQVDIALFDSSERAPCSHWNGSRKPTNSLPACSRNSSRSAASTPGAPA